MVKNYNYVVPAWTERWTAEKAEKELSGFKFDGPGFYISDEETLLVVPVGSHERPWKHKWSSDMQFDFHKYDCNVKDTVFSTDRYPPTRSDTRSQ